MASISKTVRPKRSNNNAVSPAGYGLTVSQGTPGVSNSTATNPNEPVGMTVVTNTSWDLGFPPPLPSHNADGWGYEYANSAVYGSIFTDATAPRSPSNVMRTTYQQGYGGGSAPVNMEISLTTSKTVYVAMWVKKSSWWTDNGNAGTKYFFVWMPNGDHAYIAMNSNGTHHMALTSSAGGFDYYGPADGWGTWRLYEYLFVCNSAGVSDGTFTAWKDGAPFMSRTGIRYTNGTLGFNRVQWSPTYGGGSNPVPATQYIDVDHFYISRRNT